MDSAAWSAIISGIALIAAVISPVLTTIINNSHQTKNNNRNYYESHRAEVIESYIRYTGSMSNMCSSSEDFRQYGKYSKEIYLYLPENLWHYIDEIDCYISESQYVVVSETLSQLCKELNQYHPRSIKRKCDKKNK